MLNNWLHFNPLLKAYKDVNIWSFLQCPFVLKAVKVKPTLKKFNSRQGWFVCVAQVKQKVIQKAFKKIKRNHLWKFSQGFSSLAPFVENLDLKCQAVLNSNARIKFYKNAWHWDYKYILKFVTLLSDDDDLL